MPGRLSRSPIDSRTFDIADETHGQITVLPNRVIMNSVAINPTTRITTTIVPMSGNSKSLSLSLDPPQMRNTTIVTTCATPLAPDVSAIAEAETAVSRPLSWRYRTRIAMPPALAGVNRLRYDWPNITATVRV